MALILELNGQRREFGALSEGVALDQVVTELGLKQDRVAVELNGDIVRRTAWPETSLKNGDKLEVVHFVGGGSGAENLAHLDMCGAAR